MLDRVQRQQYKTVHALCVLQN